MSTELLTDTSTMASKILNSLHKTLVISTILFICLLAIPLGSEIISAICGFSAIIIAIVTLYLGFTDIAEILEMQNRNGAFSILMLVPFINSIVLFFISNKLPLNHFGVFKRVSLSILGTFWFSTVFIVCYFIYKYIT